MFNKYQLDKREEEKIENSPPRKTKTRNFDLSNDFKSSKSKEIKINFISSRKTQTLTESRKNIRNNVYKNKKPIFKKHSAKNKNINNLRNNLENINITKDELYSAFILFQQLLLNNEDENINEENIKDKLFNFILEKKNNFNINQKKKFNNNISNSNEKRHIFAKTFYDYDRITNIYENKIKTNSFSLDNNWKSKKLINLFNLIDDNIKNTPRSVSQIIEEYSLTKDKINQRTNSQNNSRYLNHEYSYDIKNNEKNDASLQLTPEKEDINDKFFDFNNNLFNDNYNSDKKEKDNEKGKIFLNNSERGLKYNFNKFNNTEDLLIIPKFRKNQKLELMDSYSKKEKYKKANFSNSLFNNCLFNSKITISPSKNNEESYIQTQNFKKKSKESFIEPEKTNINEIKVNKSKLLCHKENLISEKIKELENEIKIFFEERQRVLRIKDEYEQLKMKLLKDKKELNLKKQIQQKYFGNEYERVKLTPKTKTNFIMNITQHNHSLIINNYKKTETINLL